MQLREIPSANSMEKVTKWHSRPNLQVTPMEVANELWQGTPLRHIDKLVQSAVPWQLR